MRVFSTPPDSAVACYKAFRIIDHDGWFYAVPEEFGPIDWSRWRQLLQHPAVLAAPSRETLELLVDDFNSDRLRTEQLQKFQGYQLFRLRDRFYAVPDSLQSIDLNDPFQCNHPAILSSRTADELRDHVRAEDSTCPIEFAGWLPVFRRYGNCGAHPQFNHTELPPTGFRFVRSGWCPPDPRAPVPQKPTWGMSLRKALRFVHTKCQNVGTSACMLARNLLRHGPRKFGSVLKDAARLYLQLRARRCKFLSVLRFIHSRHFESQLLLAGHSRPVFLTSVPFTYGQQPWMIEIEDPTSLFFPFIQNGATAQLQPRELPAWPIIRAILESPNCRAIITHIGSTARSLPVLFDSPAIAAKTFHLPMGIEMPAHAVEQDDDDEIHLLFTNSWHQEAGGFQVRGGLDVLEAFAVLRKRYPHLRLTMRTALPWLADRHQRMIEEGWVRVIPRFLTPDEMSELQRRSHVYLLPSARIHIVSLLQAMAHGQAIVASDGWGFDEYVQAERNALIVRGRNAAWMDERAGFLREDYGSLRKPNPQIVAGLVESISRLVENRGLRRRLGATARADIEERFNLNRWNDGLRAVFEKTFQVPSGLPRATTCN